MIFILRKQFTNGNKKDYYSPSIQNLMDFRIGFSSSKCALCDEKFEEQEFRLLISTSSYAYGESNSVFCFDCCHKNFPVEVLQACTSIEDSISSGHASDLAIKSKDKLEEIRNDFSIGKVSLQRKFFKINKRHWDSALEPWIKPSKSSKVRGLAALKALAYIGDKRAIKTVIKALSTADVEDRKLLSKSLYEIQRPELIDALQEAKGKDRSPYVNKYIEAALEKHESLEKVRKTDKTSEKSLKKTGD